MWVEVGRHLLNLNEYIDILRYDYNYLQLVPRQREAIVYVELADSKTRDAEFIRLKKILQGNTHVG